MRIDLTDIPVEDNEREYIKQEGAFTLKVVKLTEGKTTNNNPQIKVHFQDKLGRYAIADFVLTDNALWALKVLTKALKLPNVIDTDMMLDRYVVAHIKAKKTQNGEIFEIKKYEASHLTNTYTPPVYRENTQEQYKAQESKNHQHTGTQNELPTPLPIDIDEDEIPF
jgi:hypothetical protein